MKIGIAALVCGYFLSQFYRSFLAVLTGALQQDIGADAADLSFASGMWFLVFAAMQIPVGWALDRFGPKWTASILLAIGGGGGAVVFATASAPWMITLAMGLFGIGGSPVLMASYYIFARSYPQAMFSTLAGAMIGAGTTGNLAGSVPLIWLVEALGWRDVMWMLAGIALAVVLALILVLRDPPKASVEPSQKGSLLDLLANRNLLLIFPLFLVNYAPAAGLRGLWAGPYFADIFDLGQFEIGRATLIMAIAMALGAFAYGPAERFIGSKKQVVFAGNFLGAICCLFLWLFPGNSWYLSAVAFAAIGFFGASFPALMAHGQLFLPAHLTGRGITLLNLFGIGGVGLMQFVTSQMAAKAPAMDVNFYSDLFLVFGLSLLVGCAIYLFSSEK